MYIKSFAYGHDEKLISSFLRWWIKSGNFSKDIKIGDKIDGGNAIRDINHTIRILQKGKFTLIIEKDAIMSDGHRKTLKKDELYLNKNNGLFCGTGFDQSIKKIEKWLDEMSFYDPYKMNSQKAQIESQRFDMIGTGIFLETCDDIHWKMRVTADVVGIPK